MKVTKILIAMLASAFIVTACDPIEDEDLRDKYVTDAGTPITKEALQAAISITQPFPNQDGVVEGDQYIALKNSRPDIGGSWHIEWGGEGSKQSKTLVTDNATVIMESNADYSIYYMHFRQSDYQDRSGCSDCDQCIRRLVHLLHRCNRQE